MSKTNRIVTVQINKWQANYWREAGMTIVVTRQDSKPRSYRGLTRAPFYEDVIYGHLYSKGRRLFDERTQQSFYTALSKHSRWRPARVTQIIANGLDAMKKEWGGEIRRDWEEAIYVASFLGFEFASDWIEKNKDRFYQMQRYGYVVANRSDRN